MSIQLDCTALDLNHLFIDISRLTLESGYEEQFSGNGIVRVSTLDSGAPGAVLVAAKTIRFHNLHREPQRLALRLARELNIWAGYRHPHVLPLLGYYLDEKYREAVLIYRYMVNGDLKEYIERRDPSWDVRLHLVCDLTDGLAYLHGQTPPVFHGDLTMENVLVSANTRGMLADFGLSNALEDDPTLAGLSTGNGLKGTLRYYSPELIRDDSKHSLPSDIWAWGCLVLEALTDRIPYAEKKSEHTIIRCLMNNEPPCDIESLSPWRPDLKNLLGRCWTTQPSERPSAIDCFQVIELALPTPRLMEGIDSTTVLHEAVTAESGRSDADEEVFSDEWLVDMRRVKLYELIGSHWTDRGIGLCTCVYDEEVDQARIVVESETSDVELLRSEIGLNDVYQREQDTVIVWTRPDGTEYALSFQDVDGCAEIWDYIIEVQRHFRGKLEARPRRFDG